MKCMIESCYTEKNVTRGLCVGHRKAMNKMIKNGEYTKDFLEKIGAILPRKPITRNVTEKKVNEIKSFVVEKSHLFHNKDESECHQQS